MVWQFQGQKLKNKAQQSFNDTSKTKLLVLCVAQLKLVCSKGNFLMATLKSNAPSRLQSTYWWPFCALQKLHALAKKGADFFQ